VFNCKNAVALFPGLQPAFFWHAVWKIGGAGMKSHMSMT